MDINGNSDPIEMYKNIISALILIYQQIRNFISCTPEVHYIGLTLISIKNTHKNFKFVKECSIRYSKNIWIYP